MRELRAHLDASGRHVLVHTERGHERLFVSCRVESREGTYDLGVASFGPGTKPEYIQIDPGITIVGHDCSLTWIENAIPRAVAMRSIKGVFFKFLRLPGSRTDIIVLHEIGLERVSSTGQVVWSIGTDIVRDVEFNDRGFLVITLWDSADVITLHPETGECTRG